MSKAGGGGGPLRFRVEDLTVVGVEGRESTPSPESALSFAAAPLPAACLDSVDV